MELGLNSIIHRSSYYFVHKNHDFELKGRTNRKMQTWKFVLREQLAQRAIQSFP